MEVAKLFKNGNSQAVRLPMNFRFEGDRVYIRRLGNSVILLPFRQPWQMLVDSLGDFSDDFMSEREQPPQPVREDLFE